MCDMNKREENYFEGEICKMNRGRDGLFVRYDFVVGFGWILENPGFVFFGFEFEVEQGGRLAAIGAIVGSPRWKLTDY